VQPLLVTEYMQGGDLAAALMDDRGTERQIGWYNKGGGIAAGVASGLAYLHANKVRARAYFPLGTTLCERSNSG
jgi:hypothetical protein